MSDACNMRVFTAALDLAVPFCNYDCFMHHKLRGPGAPQIQPDFGRFPMPRAPPGPTVRPWARWRGACADRILAVDGLIIPPPVPRTHPTSDFPTPLPAMLPERSVRAAGRGEIMGTLQRFGARIRAM